MSFTTHSEKYFEYETNRFVTREEVYFDDLVKADRLDEASDFIGGHVSALGSEIRTQGYSQAFFRAALKETALPMYRKMHSDAHASQYPNFRGEITGMYDHSIILMRLLDGMRRGHGLPAGSVSTDTYNLIRGDMTELTVFALAVRNMHGIGDDITIMPSSVRQDVGDPAHNGVYNGFDFTVYDRIRDQSYPLQVKTSQSIKRYHPSIAVLPMTYFTGPLHVGVEDLQRMIMDDTDRSSKFLYKAGRRMNNILKNALRDSGDRAGAPDLTDPDDENDAVMTAS